MMLTTFDGGARMTAPDGAIVWVYCGPVAHLQPLPGGLALITLRAGARGVVPRGWLR